MEENNQKRDRIMRKRENMRQTIKLFHLNKGDSFMKQMSPTDCSGRKRRRRASQEISKFDFISVYKDQTVTNSFEELFEIQEKLGEGNQSFVFKCRQKQSGKMYAVKICKKKDLELLENMRSNYQIMKELDHEYLVKGKYLYLNQNKMTCHIVIELFQHPELRKVIRKNGHSTFSEEKTSQIIYLLLQCLDYMASKGVCHRDIKPENILYDQLNGQIKLIDFELARMRRYEHEKLDLWSHCGSLVYRAPETFKGGYGLPVDIWAVGIVTYQLLTGRVPFRSPFSAQLIHKICHEEVDYDVDHISSSALDFLKRILEKCPQKRMTPKEALSTPFILKNLRKNSVKLNQSKIYYQSFKQIEAMKKQTEEFKSLNYYDENKKFNFTQTIDRDIGVRRCEDAKHIQE